MGPFEPFRDVATSELGIDQVKRQRAFEEANPEWRIIWDKDYRIFRAWRPLANGEDNIMRHELRELLDALGAP